MAHSLDELHEQTRKLNLRDISSGEESSSKNQIQACKCTQASSTGQCAQCPRHPAPLDDASSDNKKNEVASDNIEDKETTSEHSHLDPPHHCFECKTDGDTTEQSPAPPDEAGAAQKGKEKEAEREEEQEEDEEERTLTLEDLLEYREKKGLKDGEYLLEFGFGFPEEREVNLNVQIEGDFSVTVLM